MENKEGREPVSGMDNATDNTPRSEKETQKDMCHKCTLISLFLEKCTESKGIEPNFIKEALELMYDCCGNKFEENFRKLITGTFSKYADSFLDLNCTLDKKGFLNCMKLGTMLNIVTVDGFDITEFFDTNTYLSDDSD